ncbi:cell surface A33 antigen-like [Astyanax mexicanus]|uniref:Cell surface A33 antigen-like n=1 Tax=Astyanax mexicanus TaxID=7994 RepID=A0A8T2MKS6_ASTMX|nr:cell surface A33 antigen-like [Astyanax mexicanus]
MYLSAVCTLVNREKELTITAREGESVLLPCSCTDRIASEEFTWKKLNTNRYTWEDISNESDQYRNRVQLFNNLSPANLSLLISHLTEEDDGEYRCDAKGSGYIKIRLTVRGCTLVDSGETLSITAHTGESVLLPCSCTDLNSIPDTFTWRKLRKNRQAWYKISSESDQYRNRVQLFNNLSPANLSLLISHLTEEDAGEYRCYVKQSEYINIRVTAEGVPTKTKQPSTVIPRPTSPSTSITPSPQSPTAEHSTMAPAIGVPTKTKQPSTVIPRPTSPSTSITPSPQSPTAEHSTMTPAIGKI